MLRDDLKQALKESMIAKTEKRTSTIRLILAAIKDKDIANRTTETRQEISDEQILSLLGSMIKQRNDSIEMYKQGGREDLATAEQTEIEIIYEFMPKQLSEEEVTDAIKEAITQTGATSVKDMGKVMSVLKTKYAGQMDFAKVSVAIKSALAG